MRDKPQPWHILPCEKNEIACSIVIHSLKAPTRRFVVMNRISAAEPRDITGFQHSQTQISFFAHVKQVFPKAAEFRKHVSANCVRCSYEFRDNLDLVLFRGFLPNPLVLLYIY